MNRITYLAAAERAPAARSPGRSFAADAEHDLLSHLLAVA
jgi:hypothetical protein